VCEARVLVVEDARLFFWDARAVRVRVEPIMKPLNGVVVLDLSRLLPGPFCTQLLVDLGATVIKIEDPAGGDALRHMPPLCADGTSVLFHALHRGKQSVRLDLKDARARQQFLALVKGADVVVESFRPGVLARLGLAPETLRAHNERLIVCSLSGYGAHSEMRLRAGHDLNYAARAGVLGMMANPVPLPVQVADLAGGALPAALQICAALVGRASSGKGAIVDVNMTHGAFGLLSMSLSRRAIDANETLGAGRDLLVGRVPCYGVYPTRDGFISVGALEPKFWSALVGALELPALADRAYDEGEAGDDVRAQLARVFASRTSDAWAVHFEHVDACVEVVCTPESAFDDDSFPHVHVDVDGVRTRLPVFGMGLPGAEPVALAGPALGAHDALLDTLGCVDDVTRT
jgi:crotonobetainyl-CoA:carnitine CoA-transferase CaiB-like acyl-CoA transferase